MMYVVRESRHFFAGTIHNGKTSYFGRALGDCDFDTPLFYDKAFESRADAVAAISAAEHMPYYLGNGESERPTYTPVPLKRAPEYVRDAMSYNGE